MFLFSTAFFVLSFLVPSVAGFGVGQPLQQHHSRRTASTTTLNATPLEISDALNSLSIATIDADIANIQLEEFRLVFAGGLVSGNNCYFFRRPFLSCGRNGSHPMPLWQRRLTGIARKLTACDVVFDIVQFSQFNVCSFSVIAFTWVFYSSWRRQN